MSIFSAGAEAFFSGWGHAVTRFSLLSVLFPGMWEDRRSFTFPEVEVLAAVVLPRRDSS